MPRLPLCSGSFSYFRVPEETATFSGTAPKNALSTNKKLEIWMICHPDSDHPNDKERFMEFIREANKNDDLAELLTLNLHQVVKAYHPQWIDEYVCEFVDKWRKKINHEVNKRLNKRPK